jgi:putative transcriptional regulator
MGEPATSVKAGVKAVVKATDDFDNKAASNLIKHGVSFETATFAFDDPDGLDDVEDSANYGEQPGRPNAGVVWRRLPRTFGIRRRLKLTIEEFAARFQIPADMVRAWEDGQATPDAAAVAYLRVIAHDPERVAAVLAGAVKAAAE